MGFFSSSSKRLSYDEIKELVYDMGGLRSTEQAMVLGAFEHYRSRGVSKTDIKQVIHDLEENEEDGIGRTAMRRLEQDLLAALAG